MSEIKERGIDSLHAYIPLHLAVKSSHPQRFLSLTSAMKLLRLQIYKLLLFYQKVLTNFLFYIKEIMDFLFFSS